MDDSVLRAQQLYDLKRYRDALPHYAAHLAAEPDDWHSVTMVALCHLNLSEHDRAFDAARQAVALEPNSSYTHYVLGIVCSHMSNTVGAKACLERARQLDPESSAVYSAFSTVLVQEGAWKQAIAWAEQALRLDPDDEQAKTTRAHALAATGRTGDAIREGMRTLEDNPESADAFATNGHIALHEGDHRLAIEFFKEALRLEPHNEYAGDGMHQALRCLFLPFRWHEVATLRLDGVFPHLSTGVLLFSLFLVAMISSMSEIVTWLKPFAIGFGALLFATLAIRAFGTTVVDAGLLLNRTARHYYDSERRRQLLFAGFMFLVGLYGVYMMIKGETESGFMVMFPSFVWLFLTTRVRNAAATPWAVKALFWICGPIALAIALLSIAYPDWLDEPSPPPLLPSPESNEEGRGVSA